MLTALPFLVGQRFLVWDHSSSSVGRLARAVCRGRPGSISLRSTEPASGFRALRNDRFCNPIPAVKQNPSTLFRFWGPPDQASSNRATSLTAVHDPDQTFRGSKGHRLACMFSELDAAGLRVWDG